VHHGRGGRFIDRLAHGREPYRRPHFGARRLGAVCLLLALLASGSTARAAPRPRELKANGSWHSFEIKTPEQSLPYLFEVLAGCRYRLTVECRTLDRALVAVARGDATLWSADSRPPPDRPPPGPPPKHPQAVVTWDAEMDGVLEARVRGFSAMTGRGRLKLETLGPDDEPVTEHRRLLAPGGTLARVGSLWVGEPNRWELVVRPGRTYEVRSRPGTAGRIALAVVGEDGFELASATPDTHAPYPTLRFETPPPPEGGPAPPLHLEVRSVDGGGGTYGVRLVEDPSGSGSADAAMAGPVDVPVPPLGPLEGVPLAFHAHPGDFALLFLPHSSPWNAHTLQRRTPEGRWMTLPHDPGLFGERASMRTPENAALVWFRPFRAGTYRFAEPRPGQAILKLYRADEVPAAPALLGTGLDPQVSAHGGGTWRTIGLGVCMPGWDYLFVAVGRRRASVSMRVIGVGADADALHTKRGFGPTRAPGLGPTFRFEVREPVLVRLEVQGRLWVGHAMLGRAAD